MSRALRNSRIALLACSGFAVLAGGCATGSAPSPTARTSDSRTSDSEPPSWLSQAWDSWQRSQANPSRPTSPKPRLALRAPSPLRPPELQSLQLAPTSSGFVGLGGQSLGSFEVAPALALGSSGGFVSGSEVWRGALREVEAASMRPSGPRQGGVSSSWGSQQDEMEQRQLASIQSLALRVARQRREAGADEEGLLRADLADDLARVAYLDLDGLAPDLGSPERLQRLADLRLKLLSALAVAPSAQRQADEERSKIEVEIRALLREQEKERAGLIARLRREVPERLQSQRETQIQNALSQVRQADAASINILLQGQQGRVSRDFDEPARLFLPAPQVAPAPPAQISFNQNQLRTLVGTPSSLAPIAPPARALGRLQALAPAVPDLADAGAARRLGQGSDEAGLWRSLLAKRRRAWRAPVR